MARNSDTRPLVLITGSSGLIGSRIGADLVRDHRVVGFDVDPPDPLPAGVERVECDLTSDESTTAALERVRSRHGSRIAGVIHLAAYYDFSGEESPLYQTLTVDGTRRLLRGLQSFEVEQFQFMSSLLVMKPAEPEETIDEDSPVEALWAYPRSKLEAEAVIREEHGPIPVAILRLAGVYDEWGHSLPIAQQLKRISEKDFESYFFPGDPTHGQPFIHLDDVAVCARVTLERRRELGPHEMFLIAEPDIVDYGEIQDVAGEILHGHEWPTIRIPAPIAKAGAWVKNKLPNGDSFIKPWMIEFADAHYPVSIARASERLGFEPRRRLRDVLPIIMARLRDDPVRWYRENDLELSDSKKQAAAIEERQR